MTPRPATARLRAAEPPAPWSAPQGGDLLDLNVWLALVVAEHPHHGAARRYWAEQQAAPALPGPRLWFCRATMLGLVRLLTQAKLMGDAALGLPEAHAVYRQLRATEGVGFVGDSEDADAQLAHWLGAGEAPWPARLWTDAWLAASAEAAGLRLVSFDADFRRFALTQHLQLGADAG